jgi:hypothetical protein
VADRVTGRKEAAGQAGLSHLTKAYAAPGAAAGRDGRAGEARPGPAARASGARPPAPGLLVSDLRYWETCSGTGSTARWPGGPRCLAPVRPRPAAPAAAAGRPGRAAGRRRRPALAVPADPGRARSAPGRPGDRQLGSQVGVR